MIKKKLDIGRALIIMLSRICFISQICDDCIRIQCSHPCAFFVCINFSHTKYFIFLLIFPSEKRCLQRRGKKDSVVKQVNSTHFNTKDDTVNFFGENSLKLKFMVKGSIEMIGGCILLLIWNNEEKSPKLKDCVEKNPTTVGMCLHELVSAYVHPLRQPASGHKIADAFVAGM